MTAERPTEAGYGELTVSESKAAQPAFGLRLHPIKSVLCIGVSGWDVTLQANKRRLQGDAIRCYSVLSVCMQARAAS